MTVEAEADVAVDAPCIECQSKIQRAALAGVGIGAVIGVACVLLYLNRAG